jgi:hypothetical protein
MTRKALIKTAELHRMAKVAKEFGVVIEQEIDGVKIRVAPHHGAQAQPAAPEADPWDAALDAPPEPIQPPFDRRERFAMERLLELGGRREDPFLHHQVVRSAHAGEAPGARLRRG